MDGRTGGAGGAEALNFQKNLPEIEGICGPGGRAGRKRAEALNFEGKSPAPVYTPLASVVKPLVNGRLLDVMFAMM